MFAQGRAIGLFEGHVDAGAVGRLVTGVAMVTEQASLRPEQTRTMLEVILNGLIVGAASEVQA